MRLATLGHLFVVLPKFVAFAPVVAAFGATCLWSRRRDARIWLLVAMIAIVIVGYFFWWGVANSYHFNLDRSLGPFYYYPVLVPICVLAAWGAVLVRYWRALAVAGAVVAVAWFGFAAPLVWRDARTAGDMRTSEVRTLSTPSSPSLMFEAPQFRGDPFVRVGVDAQLRKKNLVAVDVPGGRFAALDRFPNRTAFVERLRHNYDDLFGAMSRDRVALEVAHGEQVVAHMHISPAGAQAEAVYVQVGDWPPQIVATGRGEFDASAVVSAADLPRTRAATTLTLGVLLAQPGAVSGPRLTGERLACVTEARVVAGGQIEVLAPCDGRHDYVFPNGARATTAEDVSSRLSVDFASR